MNQYKYQGTTIDIQEGDVVRSSPNGVPKVVLYVDIDFVTLCYLNNPSQELDHQTRYENLSFLFRPKKTV